MSILEKVAGLVFYASYDIIEVGQQKHAVAPLLDAEHNIPQETPWIFADASIKVHNVSDNRLFF